MLGFGLLMVLSSSSVAAFRNGGSSFSVFANQATYAAVGLICFCAAQFLPVRLMRSLSTIAVIVALALLVAVLIPGIGALVNGARSWIRIGGFQFQPSEIAKLALLLWMAHVLAARRSTLGSPKALLIPVLPVFGLMAGLIMLPAGSRHHGRADHRLHGGAVLRRRAVVDVRQPRRRWAWPGSSTWRSRPTTGWPGCCRSSTRRRIRTSSYQLLQSLYGMGNGGWFGVGLGQSRAKWSYLPNADSDFIFAIIGEELGLIGAGILLLLFALLAYTGLRIARRNVDPFVKIVASASTVWLVGQAGDQHRLRRRSAAGDRHPAADDLRRRHLAADHHGGLRSAGQLRPPGTAGRGRAAGRRRQPAGAVPRHAACRRQRRPKPRRAAGAAGRPPAAAAGAAAAGRPARRRRTTGPRRRDRRAAGPPDRTGAADQRWTSAKRSAADRDRAAAIRAPPRIRAARSPRAGSARPARQVEQPRSDAGSAAGADRGTTARRSELARSGIARRRSAGGADDRAATPGGRPGRRGGE